MEKLILTLKELNFLNGADGKIKFSIDSFRDRIFYQKLFFILNELTDNLGKYRYNWYLRGPYSPDIADDLYNINDLITANYTHIDSFIESVEYSEDLRLAIEKIKNLEDTFIEEFGRPWDAIDLEILASLIFIEKYTFSECKGSEDKTLEVFRERKPELKDRHLERYLKILKSIGFFGKMLNL
ncbi:MAG: hypothetical protein ACOC44_20395 [Promethearchaeia archaeon]